MRSLVIMFCAALLGAVFPTPTTLARSVERRGRGGRQARFCWRSGGISPDPVRGKSGRCPLGAGSPEGAGLVLPTRASLSGRTVGEEYRGVCPNDVQARRLFEQGRHGWTDQ